MPTAPLDAAPGPNGPVPAIVLLHGEVHGWLEDRVFDVLASLVHRDLAAARRHWQRFLPILEAHMLFEDERILPAYREVFLAAARPDGPGRPDHVEGDHVIIVRHLEAITSLLTALDDEATLRTILEALPTFYRLTGTLEHHTLRENTHVYPALARALSPTDLDDVISILRGLVERARGT